MALSYLITGGAGFIGSHLALAVAARGARVRIFDNFETGSRQTAKMLSEAYPGSFEIVEDDLRDAAACRNACAEIDYVFHYAAIASVPRSIAEPIVCSAVNVGGTVNILAAARASGSVRRVVFASSSAVYGDMPGQFKHETDTLEPLSPYATSKLAGEHFCRNFSRGLGLDTVALRYFNVYGPRQSPSGAYASVIPKFIHALAENRPPIVFGDGEQVRDFVFVDDIVQANLLACDADASDVSGEVFNIGGGRGTTLNALLKNLSAVTGRTIDARYAPRRQGDILYSVADIAKARTVLRFEPRFTIRQGLEKMVASTLEAKLK